MNIVLSIKPEYVSEILAGRKRFEFRKCIFRRPVAKVYIYASAPISRIVGEFQPCGILQDTPEAIWDQTKYFAGINKDRYDRYFAGRATAYAIEISNLEIYNSPQEIPFQAPQSFRYIETI